MKIGKNEINILISKRYKNLIKIEKIMKLKTEILDISLIHIQ